MLRLGSRGDKVLKIQKRLSDLGFNPYSKIFDEHTEIAVINFQKSEGLLPDGIVGPITNKKLFGSESTEVIYDTGMLTVFMVSKVFPNTSTPPIEKNLPFIKNVIEKFEFNKPLVLMMLATIRAESEGFAPISEFVSKYNTSSGGHPFDLYDNRKDLGNRGKPDGERFRGRGFIQLTGRYNYKKYGEILGVDLINDCELANHPSIAAEILAYFIKDKEISIKQALLDNNLELARRLINGGTHGLDRFIDAYNVGLSLL